MKTTTIDGYYGASKTPCEVFVAFIGNSTYWYCVKGSQNVNLTTCNIEDGVDVETLYDEDTFTYSKGIESEEELITAIEA